MPNPTQANLDFRSDAVHKARDPEHLDTVLTLTTSRTWLGLAVIGALLLAVLVWSFVGRIPFRAQGLGVILKRHSVVYDVIAPADAVVEEISVEPGQRVRAGEELAVLALPTRAAQRAAARKVRDDLVRQHEQQQRFLDEDLPRRKENLEREVAALKKDEASARELLDFLQRLNETQTEDLARGYITRQQFEQTVQSLHNTESSLRQTGNEIRSRQAAHDQLVNEQRREMGTLERELLEAENQLKELEVAFESETLITSPVEGIVAEVSANPGTRIQSGSPLFLIEEAGGRLQLVGFFENAAGKKLRPGMRAQVAPSSVQQNIYGTLNGKVRAVSPLPASRAGIERVLGEPVLVDEIVRAGAPIQAWIELEPDQSTYSGLSWSSSMGPPVHITPGTQAAASVVIREERPIDLVVPILRTWTRGGP